MATGHAQAIQRRENSNGHTIIEAQLQRKED
jgi:hypothetical protein